MSKETIEKESLNSFYKYGNEEILSIEQDETSHLYKIKFTTENHYVVSREFDRSVGLYGNASDELVIVGLMEFSNSLLGKELSIYDIMDMFIDRCFDENVFDKYTSNALWLSYDYLHYEEVEDILNTYGNKIMWLKDDEKEIIKTITLKYSPASKNNSEYYYEQFKQILTNNNIRSIFIRANDNMFDFIKNCKISNISVFRSKEKTKNNDDYFEFINVE